MKSSTYLKGRRMRVFAGPNGSGKSTIFNQIQANFDIGCYINPDEIEVELKSTNKLDLRKYGLTEIHDSEFDQFISGHSIIEKAHFEGFSINLHCSSNRIIHSNKETTYSYEASLIADFLRTKLIEHGKKLTFETVMSHDSKLDVFDFANAKEYKTYLYFICTESPQINFARVEQRVEQGGHFVPKERIEERYYKTLKLLKLATEKTYRTFIWDNSKQFPELILEVKNGCEVTQISNYRPNWVNEYLLK